MHRALELRGVARDPPASDGDRARATNSHFRANDHNTTVAFALVEYRDDEGDDVLVCDSKNNNAFSSHLFELYKRSEDVDVSSLAAKYRDVDDEMAVVLERSWPRSHM